MTTPRITGFDRVMNGAPAAITEVSDSHPELSVMGYRPSQGKHLYDVRVNQGLHKPLRVWCEERDISYIGLRKKLDLLPKGPDGLPSKPDWHNLIAPYLAKAARKQLAEGRTVARDVRKVGPWGRPDIGVGMRRAMLEAMEGMDFYASPLGRLPRKGKLAILKVFKALNDHPDFAMVGHGESADKLQVAKKADQHIERYVHELEAIAKSAQAAKRLGVEDYPEEA